MTSEDDLVRRALRVALILMDVDGVLTDGKLLLVPMPDGSVVEAKAFNAQDGSGLSVARRCGIKLGILTGRDTPAIVRRAEELKIEYVRLNLGSRKVEAFEEVLQKSSIPAENVCYIGDDIQDLPVLRRVGLPVAVANACLEVRQIAAYVTHRCGGDGAVREIVEIILRAQGKWDRAIYDFVDPEHPYRS